MKNLILLLITISTQTSFATGNTSCSSTNEAMSIHVELVNSHTPGSAVLSGEATIQFKDKKQSNIIFTSQDLVGWWNLEGELKMHFIKFAQGSDFKDTQLIISANDSDVHEIHLGMAHFQGPQNQLFDEIVNCEVN